MKVTELEFNKKELRQWRKDVKQRQYDRMYNRISISESKSSKYKKRNKK